MSLVKRWRGDATAGAPSTAWNSPKPSTRGLVFSTTFSASAAVAWIVKGGVVGALASGLAAAREESRRAGASLRVQPQEAAAMAAASAAVVRSPSVLRLRN